MAPPRPDTRPPPSPPPLATFPDKVQPLTVIRPPPQMAPPDSGGLWDGGRPASDGDPPAMLYTAPPPLMPLLSMTVLPDRVLLTTFSVPSSLMTPPPPKYARLPETVQPLIVSVLPFSLAMPPP